jgi:hypothetical protein
VTEHQRAGLGEQVGAAHAGARPGLVLPLVAELNDYRVRYLEELRELLLEAWPKRGKARARLRRAIGHALGDTVSPRLSEELSSRT